VSLSPNSVPYVFLLFRCNLCPSLHDNRAQLVSDGAIVLLSVQNCASVVSGSCVSSVGALSRMEIHRQAVPLLSLTRSHPDCDRNLHVQVLRSRYRPDEHCKLQLLMADPSSIRLDSRPITFVPLEVLGPANAVGYAHPRVSWEMAVPHHNSDVHPGPDAFGNPIPDGSNVWPRRQTVLPFE